MSARPDLDDLVRLAPSPDRPVDPGSPRRWKGVERRLGTPLPDDYKRLINVYGTGNFGDFFALYNPFSRAERMNLIWQTGVPDSLINDEELGRVYPLDSDLERFQRLMSTGDSRDFPFSLFPESGGLLPMGGTSNGDSAFWLMKGPPAEWPLIFFEHGLAREQHSRPLVEFLVLWICGELPGCFFGSGNSPEIIRRDPVFCPSGQIRPPRLEDDASSTGGPR